MSYNHSFLILIISFTVLISPIYGMENNTSFGQCVELIQNSCDKKTFTNEHHRALIQIYEHIHPTNIKKHTETTAYKTFQQLDLSHIIDALNKDDRYQFKPFVGKISSKHCSALDKVTFFRFIQGRLAEHNTSVVNLAQQKPIFSEEVLSNIEFIQCFNSHNATYLGKITDAKLGSLPIEYELLAELQQQEIYLIKNAKNKKSPLQQELKKTEILETKREIEAQQQPAIQSDVVIVTDTPKQSDQLIDSSANSDITQSKEKTEIIEPQTDKNKDATSKAQPSMRLPFAKKFFINGIKLTLFAAFIYYMWHYKISAINSYL